MQAKKPQKRKIWINGQKVKVTPDIYTILNNQEAQLENHTLALYSFLEIYQTREEPTEMEQVLYQYCLQLPHAERILEEINKKKANDTEDNDKG